MFVQAQLDLEERKKLLALAEDFSV